MANKTPEALPPEVFAQIWKQANEEGPTTSMQVMLDRVCRISMGPPHYARAIEIARAAEMETNKVNAAVQRIKTQARKSR